MEWNGRLNLEGGNIHVCGLRPQDAARKNESPGPGLFRVQDPGGLPNHEILSQNYL